METVRPHSMGQITDVRLRGMAVKARPNLVDPTGVAGGKNSGPIWCHGGGTER